MFFTVAFYFHYVKTANKEIMQHRYFDFNKVAYLDISRYNNDPIIAISETPCGNNRYLLKNHILWNADTSLIFLSKEIFCIYVPPKGTFSALFSLLYLSLKWNILRNNKFGKKCNNLIWFGNLKTEIKMLIKDIYSWYLLTDNAYLNKTLISEMHQCFRSEQFENRIIK